MSTDGMYEGPITMTRKGFGFFAVGEDKEDLLIPPEWANHALSGDIVKVTSTGSYRDPSGRMPPREAGKVIEIISRARETFGDPSAGRVRRADDVRGRGRSRERAARAAVCAPWAVRAMGCARHGGERRIRTAEG